ncbi:hypothetical protein, partial [Arthrobacter sp.]|uniref:hypothetical protein n=1 Tax=Arthrobacter sp. TaxID=1667 RepID=UPI00258472D3
TTTTPSQHTRTIQQSATISAGATFQSYPEDFQQVKSMFQTGIHLPAIQIAGFEHITSGLFCRLEVLV